MIRCALPVVSLCLAFAMLVGTAHAQYRGMAPGWPNYTGGQTTAYYAPVYAQPAYGQGMYGQPMVYVARPASAPMSYAPVTAAYANPAYSGGYNAARVTAQRPITAAYYAPPTAAYYAPTYAPTTVQYAPNNSYSISPAGGSSAGAEAFNHYGQPTTVNYVPPRFAYRTVYAQVPVYMYRPVTTYQPVTGQPVTCLQPTTTTQCQTQRQRWFTHSWFSHSWFNWGRSPCGSGGCGAPAPTTAYCAPTTCNYGQCGQPYYPVQPNVIIPTVPAPTNVLPGSTAPGTIISPIPSGPASSTVPPPPTRIIPGTGVPADSRPSLPPRTTVPGATLPSFPVDPSITPGGAFNPSPPTPISPTFGSGSNYAPVTDPYSNSSASSTPIRAPQARTETAQPSIQPPSGPTLAPGVTTIPDPAADEPARPINRAPQLLDPRDKTARLQSASRTDQRWAVVPAVWPKPTAAPALEIPAESPYRIYQERSQRDAQIPAVNPAEYDDSGWKSAR